MPPTRSRVPSHQQVAEFLAEFHGLDLPAIFDDLFEQSGEAAVRHLFTVAASLDSLVLGEPQILAQVKQAYQLAQQRNSAGPLTHEMFQAALRVAKRVARETSIYEKRVSIPSVAVGDFARQIFDSLRRQASAGDRRRRDGRKRRCAICSTPGPAT